MVHYYCVLVVREELMGAHTHTRKHAIEPTNKTQLPTNIELNVQLYQFFGIILKKGEKTRKPVYVDCMMMMIYTKYCSVPVNTLNRAIYLNKCRHVYV